MRSRRRRGYEVAWKDAGTDQYTVWNTDNNGNYISNTVGAVSGASYALQSLETSFHQDLNSDGQIGLVTTVIETQGSTDLTHVADHYFLYDSVGSGPSLKFAGADVVDGSVWRLGADRCGEDGERAMRLPGRMPSTDQYTVWNTDNNGNYMSNTRRCVGSELCVAIARDQLPPGSQRRRADRAGNDSDRDARRNRSHPCCQSLFPL